jgi:hypothetical protein
LGCAGASFSAPPVTCGGVMSAAEAPQGFSWRVLVVLQYMSRAPRAVAWAVYHTSTTATSMGSALVYQPATGSPSGHRWVIAHSRRRIKPGESMGYGRRNDRTVGFRETGQHPQRGLYRRRLYDATAITGLFCSP